MADKPKPDKAQARFHQLMLAMGKMSDKKWAEYLKKLK